MSYFDWHEQPGYFGEFTRHFEADTKLLDVGCGSAWLADHFVDYTGIDSAPEAVESAVARGRNVMLASLDEPLPFADGSFDGAILKDVLEHLQDPAAAVREVRRVIRPGGRIYACSPDAQRWVWNDYTHVRPFTRVGYRRLFTDQGLLPIHVGYQGLVHGASQLAEVTPGNRLPAPLRWAAWTGLMRRNVWILAERR